MQKGLAEVEAWQQWLAFGLGSGGLGRTSGRVGDGGQPGSPARKLISTPNPKQKYDEERKDKLTRRP